MRDFESVKLLKSYHCFGSSEWEGFNNALSQKTCQIINNLPTGRQAFILLSGEKLKCKSRRTFIFLSLKISWKQSQQKIHLK